MNGSGRSGQNATLERIRKDLNITDGETGHIPMDSVHAAIVPGAAAGWVDCVERFGSGKVTLEEVLAPAIALADKGFPVSELVATFVSFVTAYRERCLTGLNKVGTWRSKHQKRVP